MVTKTAKSSFKIHQDIIGKQCLRNDTGALVVSGNEKKRT